jgi:GNAT superfamily N-acetyltransferase
LRERCAGRLGVQQGEQGKHYGENLLGDAMRRARAAALEVGGWSLFVNAKGDEAAGFYRKYGFISLPSNPLVLFMPFANMPEQNRLCAIGAVDILVDVGNSGV